MTHRASLLALAERCEGEEPSHELDELIQATLLGATMERQPDGRQAYHKDGFWVSIGLPIKPYTSSLDAALTLRPKDWSFYVDGPVGSHANVHNPSDHRQQGGCKNAPTPALALCAAALRALAAQEEPK